MTNTFNFRKWQKNDLFNLVMQEFDSAANFSISDPEERPDPLPSQPRYKVTVKHIPSEARFSIGWLNEDDATTGPFAVSYRPHKYKERGRLVCKSWDNVLYEFKEWFDAIFAEAQPDQWEEYQRASLVRPAISEQYNTPFSTQEVDHIARSFDAALDEIAQRQLLTAQQLEELTAFTSLHIKAAQSTKRIDWQSKVVEGLIAFGIERLAGSDEAKQVVEIIATHFLWLSHQIGPTIQHVTHLLRSGGL